MATDVRRRPGKEGHGTMGEGGAEAGLAGGGAMEVEQGIEKE